MERSRVYGGLDVNLVLAQQLAPRGIRKARSKPRLQSVETPSLIIAEPDVEALDTDLSDELSVAETTAPADSSRRLNIAQGVRAIVSERMRRPEL